MPNASSTASNVNVNTIFISGLAKLNSIILSRLGHYRSIFIYEQNMIRGLSQE
jgi:hypothetical protein